MNLKDQKTLLDDARRMYPKVKFFTAYLEIGTFESGPDIDIDDPIKIAPLKAQVTPKQAATMVPTKASKYPTLQPSHKPNKDEIKKQKSSAFHGHDAHSIGNHRNPPFQLFLLFDR